MTPLWSPRGLLYHSVPNLIVASQPCCYSHFLFCSSLFRRLIVAPLWAGQFRHFEVIGNVFFAIVSSSGTFLMIFRQQWGLSTWFFFHSIGREILHRKISVVFSNSIVQQRRKQQFTFLKKLRLGEWSARELRLFEIQQSAMTFPEALGDPIL